MRIIWFFARGIAFWLIFFVLARVMFLLYHARQAQELSGPTVFEIFRHGLPLDISTASYLMLVPLLIALVQLFARRDIRRITDTYHYVLIVLASLLTAADMQLYTEWGVKVNAHALSYLRYPREVLASAGSSPFVLLFALFLLQAGTGIWIYRRLTVRKPFAEPGRVHIKSWKALSASLLCAAALVIGMRGGLSLIPINQSSAYFSGVPFVNHASLNTLWNLANSVENEGLKRDNPYNLVPQQLMESTLTELYPSDTFPARDLLTLQRPNIMLVVMESFTSDLIASLGGEKEICPGFEKLVREGVLFTDAYASGDRTDKGLVAILSGFPAQPASSIITSPSKVEKLPSLAHALQAEGYSASFFYGGESEFANIRAYLVNSGYTRIVDRSLFSRKDMNSKWGAHDHVMLDTVLEKHRGWRQPFFTTVLTLSNHEPFEIPGNPVFPVREEGDLMRNSANYTDKAIGAFLEKARKEPWYPSTLFVFVADHGHRLPKDYPDVTVPGKFRIPLLLYGEVLKKEWRGTKVGKIVSQTDLPATLLKQLSLSSKAFGWSRDMLSPSSQEFAFYAFHNGFGWITPSQQLIFDNVSKTVRGPGSEPAQDTSGLYQGKAYQQAVMQQYSSY
jgi:phosphoglycerol transferase MdoB-like AlkP superfamily enzyme